MVEVFKTNISDKHWAATTLNDLQRKFQHYKANFDLEDCDRILRVESKNGDLKVMELLKFLKERDVKAEVLPD